MDKINTTQAARLLNLSRRTVYDLIKAGRLAAQKFGRDYAISLASVEAEAKRRAARKERNNDEETT